MKKIIYRKFLYECLIFFIITLTSASVIIWVFQAVNYLDIIIDDGRDYLVYLNYSLLNFPKIFSKILPFALFFSFSYVIAKYELNNQLLIYWNFGISKISFVNFFLFCSLVILLIQLLLTTFIVPNSQSLARSIIRVSDYNFVDNFIKVKKFNAAVNNLTIYTESKTSNNNYKNIYIKKNNNENGENNFQIIFAKKGTLKNKNGLPVLELYEGENINVVNKNITNFTFSKSEFNLSTYTTDTILVKKTQEHRTVDLINCTYNLLKNNIEEINKLFKTIKNCEFKNLDNIFSELYKRLIIPIYLPVLMLTSLLLIIQSKEKINYTKYRFSNFLLGFLIIIFSESTLRFINKSLENNLILISIPIILIIMFYFYFLNKFKFKKT